MTEQLGQHELVGGPVALACEPVGPLHGHAFNVQHWRKLGRPLLAAAGVSLAGTIVAVANPFRHHLSPPCPFHALTGLWCPFCGGTRAVWAATHGDLRLMLHANALLPFIAVAMAWRWLDWVGRATGWWRLPVPNARKFNVVLVTVLVTFTVVRNLPGLSALAPPAVA